MHLFGQPPGINSALNADRDNATTSKSENISGQLDTNALFLILKSLIGAFIIKICRNLNEKVRLRQIPCLKVVVISYFL